MKLVTLETRLIEADENKKNYQLYLIRMKEQDNLLNKKIDELRSISENYDRIMVKLIEKKNLEYQKKENISNEILYFAQDIKNFQLFCQHQIDKYKSFISQNIKNTDENVIELSKIKKMYLMFHAKRLKNFQN